MSIRTEVLPLIAVVVLVFGLLALMLRLMRTPIQWVAWICQIVGPVCQRVVYWLPHGEPAEVVPGERIGMMKFGSREP